MTVPQHTPTNKLLYAKDIPMFKQEVKAYYRQVRDQQPGTASEFKDFLLQESKVAFVFGATFRAKRGAGDFAGGDRCLSFQKHENEFNEAVALRELYKFIRRYFTEVGLSRKTAFYASTDF